MRQFIPTLLRMARIAPGQKVLDVATGTGLAAEEAVIAVGASGHVTAVDGTFEMLDQARQRLAAYPNAAVKNVSAENLMLPGESFDGVICCMALMIFSDRSSAMAGMRRALRTGGRMAASVNTTPERTLTGRVRANMRHPVVRRLNLNLRITTNWGGANGCLRCSERRGSATSRR